MLDLYQIVTAAYLCVMWAHDSCISLYILSFVFRNIRLIHHCLLMVSLIIWAFWCG